MLKSVIFWTFTGAILAYLGKYLKDMGVFRPIQNYGLNQCHLMVPPGGNDLAFEDLAIDYDTGIAYLPGDYRVWWGPLNPMVGESSRQGATYVFDIVSEKFEKLELVKYPYDHFHPLGVGLLKAKTNHLFMANYRKEDEKIVGSVDIFRIDPSNSSQLEWVESVVDPLFTAPDDVLAIDQNTFFVTNVYHYRIDHSSFWHTFELFTKRPWTELILCSKTTQWQCSVVIDSIIMANGLAASLDLKTIYVAASTEKRVRVYDRDVVTNALTYKNSLPVSFMIDNLHINEHDQLIAAGHPNALAFSLHEKNPRERRAPSEVVLFTEPKSSSTQKLLLLSDGELITASTVGATYKNKLLVGALYDSGILVCKDFL